MFFSWNLVFWEPGRHEKQDLADCWVDRPRGMRLQLQPLNSVWCSCESGRNSPNRSMKKRSTELMNQTKQAAAAFYWVYLSGQWTFLFLFVVFLEMELLHSQIERNSNFLCVLKVMFATCCQYLREMSKVTGLLSSVELGEPPWRQEWVPRMKETRAAALQPRGAQDLGRKRNTPLSGLQGRWWLVLSY